MANICLDSFLNSKEERLSDLDWLDVDVSEYENIPFNDTPEYIAIPKLQEAWNYETERSNFNLVPNSDFDFNYKPADPLKVANEKINDAKNLVKFTKMQMMSGKKGSELKNLIQERSNSEVIKNAYDYLKKLSDEQGLLGYVYIDPTVFSKCEEGAEFVRKRAKTAKYLKSMDKCSGCAFNREGRCEIYKKSLASEINYNSELFNFYSKHFSNLTGKEVTIQTREQLKKAFSEEKKQEVKIAEFKPKISKTDDEEKSLKEKKEKFNDQLKSLQEEIKKVFSEKISKDLGYMIIKGYGPAVINKYLNEKYKKEDLLNNQKTISNILVKQGSLGKIYIDSAYLPVDICNARESREFFNKNVLKPRYILSSCRNSKCSCKTIASKKIINSLDDIPQEYWDATFNSYPSEITHKISSIYQQDKQKGLRLAHIKNSGSHKSLNVEKDLVNFQLTSNVNLEKYTSSELKNDFNFSPKNVGAALAKGFTLSKIVKTAKTFGLNEAEIKSNITKAFENYVSSINKYQVDIDLNLPSNVKVKMSGKDISLDLMKENSEKITLSYDSSNAPMDNLVNELNLKESNLDSSIKLSNYEDISIGELDEFNIE
jgi:hypothetical protein